jgi:hypothetical protein
VAITVALRLAGMACVESLQHNKGLGGITHGRGWVILCWMWQIFCVCAHATQYLQLVKVCEPSCLTVAGHITG